MALLLLVCEDVQERRLMILRLWLFFVEALTLSGIHALASANLSTPLGGTACVMFKPRLLLLIQL
jgi:hypothetical protein